MPTISVRFWLKTATDFKLSHMEFGMPPNVFFGKQNVGHPRLQIVLATSS